MSGLRGLFLDLNVRRKLLVGFGLVLAITLAIAWISYQALNTVLDRFAKLSQIAEIKTLVSQARLEEKNFVLRMDTQHLDRARDAIEQTLQITEQTRAGLHNPANLERISQIEESATSYRRELTGFDQSMQHSQAAQQAMEKAAREALAGFASLERGLRQKAVGQIQATGDSSSIETLDLSILAVELSQKLLDSRRLEKNYVMRAAQGDADSLLAQLDAASQAGKQLLAGLTDQAARRELESALQSLELYRAGFNAYLSAYNERVKSENDMTERARSVVAQVENAYSTQLEELRAEHSQVRQVLVGATAVALVLGLICAALIIQMIVAPLQRVVGVARKVAEGDLSSNLTVDRRDEIGQLMQAMQAMTESLRGLLSKLSGGIEQLATATEEMSAVTEQTSVGVSQQKLETDQVATAMNEMTATVQDVARNAESAANSASSADIQAQQGRAVVEQTIGRIEALARSIDGSAQAIERLKQDSGNIGGVLDVIKSIAEQTNLLALNAAIEAARAGEAGRGFAVVADEVRALARRTQESTAQIEQLIGTLQTGAQGAVEVMGQSCSLADRTVEAAQLAGEALQGINAAVSSIQQMNQQIATAAEQQSAVAEEINRSVSNIRDVADQSATATEQTSAASADLARLGADLQAQVARFRLA